LGLQGHRRASEVASTDAPVAADTPASACAVDVLFTQQKIKTASTEDCLC